MRYVYFLLLAVLITGCAQGRLRLRKLDKEDRQELVEQKVKKERSYAFNKKRQIIESSEAEVESEEIASNVEETSENESLVSTDVLETEAIEVHEIATEATENDPSKQQKVRQAFIAEQDAKRAKNSFIWSISMFATLLVPFLSIIALFSIVPFILGSIKLSQSNKSDYITLEGERVARSARIMQLVYGVLLTVTIIAITAILIIFFL